MRYVRRTYSLSFQKSFDLALIGAAQERKLGKQRSVFPGRWGTKKVASRKLGSKASGVPSPSCLWHDTLACRLGQALNGAHWAPAPPKGGGETWLPLWGRYVPVGRCPAADRGGSRDAVAARRLRGQPASAPHSSVSPRRRLYQRAAHALGGVTGKLGAKISAASGGTEDPRRGSST